MTNSRRELATLLLLAVALRLAVAALIPHPGYMDAAYYASGALRLAQHGSLSDPFLWNYLDHPTGLPHPGFLYWMPLPSLLAAPFAAVFPDSFFALQIPFALLSALLPSLTYWVAWRATHRRRTARLAGAFTLLSGLFLPYWTITETFTPFALFGGASLWLMGESATDHPIWKVAQRFGIGVLLGLAHLTRSDAPLLLGVLVVAPLLALRWRSRSNPSKAKQSKGVDWEFGFRDLALALAGYLLTMAPWFVRNLSAVGTPLPSTGTKTLWLRTYDDLFCYDCTLSLRSYLDWGWSNILRSKLWALRINLLRFLAENCLIFLLPFTLIGLYRLRRKPSFALATLFLLLVYCVHSLIFTYPGPRGGFFHASTALLPFLHVAAAEGIDATVSWAGRRRRWNVRQAQTIFGIAAALLALLVSAQALTSKVPAWRSADGVYHEIDAWLEARGIPDDEVIMVGNPPAFWYHTRRPAVVVPNEDVNALLEVCRRYSVGYLVLDPNRPDPLSALYEGRVHSPQLSPQATFAQGDVVLLKVEP